MLSPRPVNQLDFLERSSRKLFGDYPPFLEYALRDNRRLKPPVGSSYRNAVVDRFPGGGVEERFRWQRSETPVRRATLSACTVSWPAPHGSCGRVVARSVSAVAQASASAASRLHRSWSCLAACIRPGPGCRPCGDETSTRAELRAWRCMPTDPCRCRRLPCAACSP